MRGCWIALLAGCYSASPVSGAPCDPNSPACPAGQMCVSRAGQFVCDLEPSDPDGGGTDMAAGIDLDGDGVPNALDNCPTMANPNQANEDADAFGDVCDKCPPYPDTGADADNDNVGDACDPHVLIPGDSIAYFEGFSIGAVLPSTWTRTGTWIIAGGALGSVATNNDLNTLVIPYTNTPHQTISASATITALTGTSGGSIGVADRFDGNDGVHCGGGRSATSGLFALINAANGVFIAQTPHPFEIGTLYRLTLGRVDNNYVCSTIQLDGTMTMVQDQFTNTAGPYIGFRNRVASAAFAWVMVVKSP